MTQMEVFFYFHFVQWKLHLLGTFGTNQVIPDNTATLLCIFAVLFIHMDEQMDGRTLIGSYICTEKPGEFKWAPGSLTQVCTVLLSR